MPTGIYERRPRKPLQERFDAKWVLNQATGCHEWTACLTAAGYGQIGLGGRADGLGLAHRVAWELRFGPIPHGMCILHLKCDNPRCVNTDHLGLGTQAENISDMVAKGRQMRGEPRRARALLAAPRGERHCCARFTDEQIRTMRALYAGGRRQCDLARDFNTRSQTINKIVRGMRRKDIL